MQRARSVFTRSFIAVLGIASLLILSGPARAGFEETITLAGDNLEVRNLIGEIRVTGHDGSSFEVVVNVRGRDASPDVIRIETREGRSAGVAVIFPLDEERNYVYPELGSGSRTSFTLDRDDSGWLQSFFDGVFGRKINVRGRGDGLEVWADMEIRVPAGASLELKHGVGDIEAGDVEGNLVLDSNSGRVIARNVRGEVTADTGSGAVEISDIEGDLVVDTGSGRVEATRVRGASVSIDTGSGGVTLEQIEADDLNVDTGSGGVRAERIKTDSANIDTGSGAVTLELDRMGSGSFRIDTGSGGITLRLPPGASAEVEAETGSGGIHIDMPDVQIRRKSEDHMSFQVGGGGARVSLDTGSGGIRITESR